MEQTAYLGLDVSKGYCDFILLDSNKKILIPTFVLDDTREGRKQLQTQIEQWQGEGLVNLFCGVESTGGYENNWFRFLRNLGRTNNCIQTARLNPRAVKAVSDGSLRRTITDAVSAENIALYLLLFPEKVEYKNESSLITESVFGEGRQHFTYVKMLIKQKTQLSNQFEKILYQYFPELLVYCRHGIPNWVLRLLCKYPCAALVYKAGVEKITALKGISKEKSAAIIGKLSKEDQMISKQLQHIIFSTAKEILHKDGLITVEKLFLKKMYEQNSQVKRVSSIRGIGIESAIIIMLEIEDINRFSSAKKMASYFGVHPCFKQSGDGIWGNHLSKKGRGEIRGVLYMTALSGIRYNSIIKKMYARFRAKGMKHLEAMGVVMHKLLRIVFGVLKNDKDFDQTVDETNVEKAKNAKEALEIASHTHLTNQNNSEEKKENNRYQNNLSDAPISRRKYQKIKKATNVPVLSNE